MRDTWLLEMPSQPQGLDQIVHPPSGHAFYIGLLDDGQQGFLAAPPWFQQAGEVAAFPQLGWTLRILSGMSEGVCEWMV